MKSELERYTAAKQRAEEARARTQRARGALDNELAALKQFNCTTLEDAKRKLHVLQKQFKRASRVLQEAREAFCNTYEEKVNDADNN